MAKPSGIKKNDLKKSLSTPKRYQRFSQATPFVKGCATFGKLMALIPLVILFVLVLGTFLYMLVVSKKTKETNQLLGEMFGLLLFLFFSIFIIQFLYDKFPTFMCYLFLFNLVVSTIWGFILLSKIEPEK